MKELQTYDYAVLDVPEVLSALFHPRREFGNVEAQGIELMIPVEPDIDVGARFHPADPLYPTLLFFHGNGEIAADYDDLAPVFNRLKINFLVVDYRGYGRSGGRPTVAGMMRDSLVVFRFVQKWLDEEGYSGPLLVMGRSLGSASALELAARCREDIDGLIIESGFAHAKPLLSLVGADVDALNLKDDPIGNLEKIRCFDKPTLIIHAENDQIIPYSDGQDLFGASAAREKRLLQIPGANHNDILFRGLAMYMKAVSELVKKTSSLKSMQ